MSIRVVAHITVRPEKVDETRELLLSLVEPTRVEAGCVRYELMQNTADPTDFTFIEEWTSDAALDAHLETEHLKRAAAQGAELFAVPPDIRRYKFLG